MTEAGIYTTNALVEYKAGVNASAAAVAEAFTNEYIAQAEAYINVMTRKIWAVDTEAFAALNPLVSKLLASAASDIAAVYIINYDMSGFTSRQEALTMINILWARAQDSLKLLNDDKARTFMEAS